MARESEWDRLFRQGVILPLSFEEQNPFLAMVIRKQEEKRAMEIEALARIARRAMFPENEGWEAQWSELSEGWRRAWCRVAQAVLDAQEQERTRKANEEWAKGDFLGRVQISPKESVEPRRPKLGDIVHYVPEHSPECPAIVVELNHVSVHLCAFEGINPHPVVYQVFIEYSRELKPGTWHFPEDD